MLDSTSLPSPFRRLFWPITLSALGVLLCFWIIPRESGVVAEHILGFPDTDIEGHRLRPWILGLLCLLPAIASWIYAFAGSLDRYMTRQFLTSFCLVMGALMAILLLTDLQNRVSDFREADDTWGIVTTYYSIHVPAMVVFILPYGLLLSLLYCLGKMSNHQEIVAMIQTGRGVFRIVLPLIITGIFSSLICLAFNYHWGPWAEGHRKLILQEYKNGEADRAQSVLYRDALSKRVWLVGAFPHRFEKTGIIKNVIVRSFDERGVPTIKLEADQGVWSRETKNWTFSGNLHVVDLTHQPVPIKLETAESVSFNWQETPWQIIKPGLEQKHLGIPELNSWLRANEGIGWANRLPYLTQWHYRIAQPIICLVIIILSAPLGIVFSRRGTAGGVSVALFLSAGMLFTSSIFITLGEAGHLPPVVAAWSTNILFSLIALYLFHRRMTGRSIYQSLLQILPLKS